MDKAKRLHRPDPERDGPVRDAMSFMRDAGVGARANAKPRANGAADATEDILAHGVKLGYAVIDDQILRGERLAERLRPANGKSNATPAAEISTLIERALNLYKDMGALALTAAEALARSPMVQGGIARAWPGTDRAEPARSHDKGSRFTVELTSSRRTHITLDLRPTPGNFVPLVHAMHAANSAYPPLTGAHFKVDATTLAPVLHLDVPDAQPPATYSGVVVDSVSNEPCGTLSVRILP